MTNLEPYLPTFAKTLYLAGKVKCDSVSIKLMVQVYERETTHPQQAVLLAMSDHANDEGKSCYPSVDRIAWKTGYSPRHVVRVIGELKKKGVLVVVSDGGGRSATEYRIDLSALAAKTSFEEWRQGHGRYATGDKPTPVTKQAPAGDKSSTEPVTPLSPQPSRENHKKEPIKKSTKEKEAERRRRQMIEVFGPNAV